MGLCFPFPSGWAEPPSSNAGTTRRVARQLLRFWTPSCDDGAQPVPPARQRLVGGVALVGPLGSCEGPYPGQLPRFPRDGPRAAAQGSSAHASGNPYCEYPATLGAVLAVALGHSPWERGIWGRMRSVCRSDPIYLLKLSLIWFLSALGHAAQGIHQCTNLTQTPPHRCIP